MFVSLHSTTQTISEIHQHLYELLHFPSKARVFDLKVIPVEESRISQTGGANL